MRLKELLPVDGKLPLDKVEHTELHRLGVGLLQLASWGASRDRYQWLLLRKCVNSLTNLTLLLLAGRRFRSVIDNRLLAVEVNNDDLPLSLKSPMDARQRQPSSTALIAPLKAIQDIISNIISSQSTKVTSITVINVSSSARQKSIWRPMLETCTTPHSLFPASNVQKYLRAEQVCAFTSRVLT